MKNAPYNRQDAVAYALKWALSRNPKYYDFGKLGGDCTNFISQCLYAGAKVMNYAPTYGWYFISLNNRAPAWTSVQYLYQFLTTNKSVGPYAHEVKKEQLMLGDIVQMQIQDPSFEHTAMVTDIRNGVIYVSAHDNDAKNRALSTYLYKGFRYLHIDGVRKWE